MQLRHATIGANTAQRAMITPLLIIIFIVTILMACTTSASLSSNFKFVLMGDDDSVKFPELFNTFIRLAASTIKLQQQQQQQQPYIGIVPAASVEPQENYDLYSKIFTEQFKLKRVVWIPIDTFHIGNNSNPEVLDQLKQVNGLFFCGGDQMNLVKSFYFIKKLQNGTAISQSDSPALKIIRDRFTRGELVVSGTSAGTAIWSGQGMITGGESYEALKNGAFTEHSEDQPDDLSYYTLGGFGMFPYGLLDTVCIFNT